MYDRIRILVVDDEPSGLSGDIEWDGDDRAPPGMDIDFKEWFEFRWLASAEESCEFRDLSWLIAQHDERLLHNEGWVPDLLAIDYALSQNPKSVAARVSQREEWYKRLSPLPGLRACANRVLPGELPAQRKMPVTVPAGSDSWGCFVGGLLLSTFSDHPCAPVTVTRYTQDTLPVAAPDAAVFEWLLHVQTDSLLRAVGLGASPTWKDIIYAGLQNFRKRLSSLAKSHIITPSLDDLLAIAGGCAHPILSVTSRYGRRRYPVTGIFLDGQETPSQWAEDLLKVLLPPVLTGITDVTPNFELNNLIEGRRIHEDLWSAYDEIGPLSGLFKRRLRLSELVEHARVAVPNSGSPPGDANPELSSLLAEFGVSDHRSDGDCLKSVWDIRAFSASDAIKRWAVLLTMVRLLARRYTALQESRPRPLPEGVKEEDFLDLGRDVTSDDLFLALFPIAKNPLVLPNHSPTPSKAKNAWQAEMARMRINVDRLADGKAITNGERFLLRMFAESLDYNWRLDISKVPKGMLSFGDGG